MLTKEERENLICKIKDSLTASAQRLADAHAMGRSAWTRECIAKLAELGKNDVGKRKYDVAPDIEVKRGEWLYDLIWWENSKVDDLDRMGDLVLALESEWSWSPFDVRYDFQKLIQAKAQIKVMISDALDSETEAMLKADVNCFAQNDIDEPERYLFAIYDHTKKNFRFKKLFELHSA